MVIIVYLLRNHLNNLNIIYQVYLILYLHVFYNYYFLFFKISLSFYLVILIIFYFQFVVISRLKLLNILRVIFFLILIHVLFHLFIFLQLLQVYSFFFLKHFGYLKFSKTLIILLMLNFINLHLLLVQLPISFFLLYL